jgi:hypothetical protein
MKGNIVISLSYKYMIIWSYNFTLLIDEDSYARQKQCDQIGQNFAI